MDGKDDRREGRFDEAKGDVKGFEIGLAGLRRNIELTSDGAAWGVKMLADYEQTGEPPPLPDSALGRGPDA